LSFSTFIEPQKKIFGIRNAGLAVSVGSWSGVSVLMSFAWGIFTFGESVDSVAKTLCGIFILLTGFVGMSYFSSASQHPTTLSPEVSETSPDDEYISMEDAENDALENFNENDMQESSIEIDIQEYCNENDIQCPTKNDMHEPLLQRVGDGGSSVTEDIPPNSSRNHNNMHEPLLNELREGDNGVAEDIPSNQSGKIYILGMHCNKRTIGIIGAVIDGILGGSALVPMHYSSAGGLQYVTSFGIGAIIVTAIFWILLFIYHATQNGSLELGRKCLPSMHLKALLVPGIIAGTLWSIGNIGAILSVTYLGQSIGFSIVQCQMIVSGLWGIVWFGEIQGIKAVIGWMASALLTLVSIILLGREHDAE